MTALCQSNGEGVGGPIEFLDSAEEAAQSIVNYVAICGIKNCHFLDENGNKMKMDVFLTHFLPRGTDGFLQNPMYETFDIRIDQSNEPQTFTIRPSLDTRDHTRKLVEKIPFGRRALALLKRKNRSLGEKAA